MSKYSIIEELQFRYIETNPGKENLVLLHGLFGSLSNFEGIITKFGDKYNVVVPILPIFELPKTEAGLDGLLKYFVDFVSFKKFKSLHLIGNSLGGHIAQLFALEHMPLVKSLVLTGSSGLFEAGLGKTFPPRGKYEFVKDRTQKTFYNPKMATKEMVDEVYETVNNRQKVINLIVTAKSAMRHNLEKKIPQLKMPTLLVWGKQDTITPPFVAEKFNSLIENSKVVLIDKCGHAPMMEHPDQFNDHVDNFLSEL